MEGTLVLHKRRRRAALLRVAVRSKVEEDEAAVDWRRQLQKHYPHRVAAFEFVVDLDCRPHSRLYLLNSFAMSMASRTPDGFWLQVEGCPNGLSWVLTEYAPDDAILLGKGWKTFARFRCLSKGQFLAFRFNGD